VTSVAQTSTNAWPTRKNKDFGFCTTLHLDGYAQVNYAIPTGLRMSDDSESVQEKRRAGG
jgi:hypothetical protein